MDKVKIVKSIAILSAIIAVAACDPPGDHKTITFKPQKSLDVITRFDDGQMIVNVNDETSGANWVDCVPNSDEGCRQTFLIEDAKPPAKDPRQDNRHSEGEDGGGGDGGHH